MQTVVKNPDPRLLPQGWAEHFDSQRKIWYYIDLDSVPPRASFVHPCDELRRIKGKGRMTISHELAPEESSFSGSDTTTFAQRLYATSVSASLPQPPSSGSSISSTGLATHLEHPRSSSSPGLASGDSSSSNPASSTYSISPSPLPAEQSNSDRPKLFGPRQPRNSRHRSASSPAVRSPLAAEDTDIYGTPTLYHPVVVASTTPPGRRITSLEVKRADNQASIGSGVKPTGAPDCIPKALPPIPNATDISKPPATPLIMAPPTIRRLAKRYSAVTEDNIYVAPVPPGVSSSPALTQERPLPLDVALIHTNIDPPSLDAQRFIQRPPTSLEQAILQPKPIKPLKGVSLSLQNQVVESSTPPPVNIRV
ncbi:hypothetical protein B0H34DRAFT_34686 [Crassisporium funariophilum]|nr:hypothetical protein B0H34DRAFT_34686 [Crassisporium funariophilum]